MLSDVNFVAFVVNSHRGAHFTHGHAQFTVSPISETLPTTTAMAAAALTVRVSASTIIGRPVLLPLNAHVADA